jgi:hypothetical protein
VFEVGGLLPGGIDADVEVGLGVLAGEGLEALLQRLVAGPVLQDGEGLGSRQAIRPQEGDPMAVACGVDADADALEGRGRGYGSPPERREGESALGPVRAGGRRERPPGNLSQAILVISGQRRMMYRSLALKPEGTIFFKRSKPQGTDSSPHSPATSMAEQLEVNIQGDTVEAEG